MKNINYLIKGIYAGVMIGIGGIAYLSITNKIIGAFIFSIGLISICIYNMNLYTGKIGYILNNKPSYIFELLFTLIGNFIGAFLVGNLINLTRFNNLSNVAKEISIIKLNDSELSIFLLSVFCGILMYIAVNTFKKYEKGIEKIICIFICVICFILCGFEHCIANIFYFSIANIWNINTIYYLLLMILGNSIGSILMSLYNNNFMNK